MENTTTNAIVLASATSLRPTSRAAPITIDLTPQPRTAPAKPPKPYPSFPMFSHHLGYWAKKIRGKHVRLGRWVHPDVDEAGYLASWVAALSKLDQIMAAFARGDDVKANPRRMTLSDLIDRYLSERHVHAERGEIEHKTFVDIRVTLTAYRDGVGASLRIDALEADSTPLRAYLDGLRDRFGWCAYNRSIRNINALWNWAKRPASEILDRPFKWTELHRVRAVRERRRERREARARGVMRTFTVDELRAIFAYARQPLRAAVLLGYFAAYGNGDIAKLPRNALTVYEEPFAVHLHGRVEQIPAGWGLLYFPRPKTEMDRYAIVPPVVVEAMREADAGCRRAASPANAHLAIRTERGTPMRTEHSLRDAVGLIRSVVVTDNVAQQFERLLRRLGTCATHGIVEKRPCVGGQGNRRGPMTCPTCDALLTPMKSRGFYALRHTATTFAVSSGASNDARNVFEGHASGTVRAEFYLEPSELHELLLIARELEGRLKQPASAGVAA